MTDKLDAYTVDDIEGRPVRLSAYAGQVRLFVNVASQCGFTPQYAGLEALHRKYRDRGFSVLAFPCNQFGGQEPGTDASIRFFCTATYAVSFPLFAKIAVNGPQTAPVYAHLKQARPGLLGGTAIRWNFTKFLVDRDGAVVARYASWKTPAAIEGIIVRLLG